MQTRSKSTAAATVALQPATTTQAHPVTVNWVFFDSSHPNNNPVPTDVPRTLFDSASRKCKTLFATELLEEYGFQAVKHTIQFWKPKEQLLVDTAGADGWTEAIDNDKFNDEFVGIPLTRSLAKALTGLENDDAVHLIVIAEGTYQVAEAQDAGGDAATALPKIRRYRGILSTPGKSPSIGARSGAYNSVQADLNKAIHDGRYPRNPPFSTVAPPVEIFHPVFGKFVQLANDHSFEPSPEDLIKTQELMGLLSIIGTAEATRNPEVRTKLSDFLNFDIHEEKNNDGTHPDGVTILVVNDVRVPLLIVELKRELGEGHCDPSTQAGLSMRRSWIQKDREGIRDKCCCPTLLLAGGGPWLCVMGAVFTDKIIVQRLTDMMWVGHASTEENARVYRFARVLGALRQCLLVLKDFYTTIGATPPSPDTLSSRFDPYPTSYRTNDGLTYFEYTRTLEDDAACVTYQAKIVGEVDSADIVVKFVTRYGREVHEFLAKHGHAPNLRYCGPLSTSSDNPDDERLPTLPPQESPGPDSNRATPPVYLGPMQMIVMDYVSSCAKPPADALDQLKSVLTLLHSEGYVLGDLRRQNVLFDEENKVKIIDLDWTGRYDMNVSDVDLSEDLQRTIDENKERVQARGGGPYVRYPLNLSTNIQWAKGVRDLAPIRPQHDWDMVAAMSLAV